MHWDKQKMNGTLERSSKIDVVDQKSATENKARLLKN